MLFSFTYILIQYNSPLKINTGPSSRICGLRTYYNSFEEKKKKRISLIILKIFFIYSKKFITKRPTNYQKFLVNYCLIGKE